MNMTETINKKLVSWTIFVWAVSILTFLIAGLFSMSGTALNNSNNNRNRIGVIEERENNHYNEIIKILERIEDKLK